MNTTRPSPAFYTWIQDNLDTVRNVLGKDASKRDIVDTLIFMWSRLDKKTKDFYILQEQELLKVYRDTLCQKLSKL